MRGTWTRRRSTWRNGTIDKLDATVRQTHDSNWCSVSHYIMCGCALYTWQCVWFTQQCVCHILYCVCHLKYNTVNVLNLKTCFPIVWKGLFHELIAILSPNNTLEENTNLFNLVYRYCTPHALLYATMCSVQSCYVKHVIINTEFWNLSPSIIAVVVMSCSLENFSPFASAWVRSYTPT